MAMLLELPLPAVPAVPLDEGEPLALLEPAPVEPLLDADPALPDVEPAAPVDEPEAEPLTRALVSMNWLPPIRALPVVALPVAPVVPLVPVAPAVLPPPCRHPVTVTVRLLVD